MGTTSADVVVIGAGPAGLMAAWHAARSGRSVVVLEREDRVGGLAGSVEIAGLRVDHGSHRLHPSTPPHLLAEIRGLLGDDLQVRPRHGRIRLADRWLGYPLSPLDLVRSLPRPVAARASLDAVTSPLRRGGDDFASAVRAGLGPTVASLFYEPYARKLWGVEPSQLDADLARRRVSANSPTAIVRRLARGRRSGGSTFLYPRRGFGQIPEAIAAAAVDAGAEIRCGAPVVGLGPPGGDRVQVVTGDGALEAGVVLSTLPVTVLARMIDPDPPPAVAAATARLRTRAMVLVHLVLDRAPFTPFDAHYFPQADEPVARCSEPRNYRHDPAQPCGVTVLCAELPCEVGDPTWARPDDELGAAVAASLDRMGLPGAEPVDVVTRRIPHLYPVLHLGYADDLAVVERWLDAVPRVVTLGRAGLFTGDNTHHALAMGAAAATALQPDVGIGDGIDRAAWSAARARFLDHVVED